MTSRVVTIVFFACAGDGQASIVQNTSNFDLHDDMAMMQLRGVAFAVDDANVDYYKIQNNYIERADMRCDKAFQNDPPSGQQKIRSQSDAQQQCDADPNCGAIYDYKCDGSWWVTCRTGLSLEDQSGSCVYEKEPAEPNGIIIGKRFMGRMKDFKSDIYSMSRCQCEGSKMSGVVAVSYHPEHKGCLLHAEKGELRDVQSYLASDYFPAYACRGYSGRPRSR